MLCGEILVDRFDRGKPNLKQMKAPLREQKVLTTSHAGARFRLNLYKAPQLLTPPEKTQRVSKRITCTSVEVVNVQSLPLGFACEKSKRLFARSKTLAQILERRLRIIAIRF